MRKLVNFALFQATWFVAVGAAARGSTWVPVAAVLALCAAHLALVVRPGARARELRLLVGVGLAGTAADALLLALGATAYPAAPAAWPAALVPPPLITGMWIAFATLLRYSLAWLAGRTGLAALLGAVGGPLSYLAGVRLGAVAVGDGPLVTYGLLALEYALATPLLLALAGGPADAEQTPAAQRTGAA